MYKKEKKKKRGGVRWGKGVAIVLNTNRLSKGTRFKVWNALSAQRSFTSCFSTVCRAVIISYYGTRTEDANWPEKTTTDDVQLFSSACFICFPLTFIETGLFCGSLFESWLVTHSKLWAKTLVEIQTAGYKMAALLVAF